MQNLTINASYKRLIDERYKYIELYNSSDATLERLGHSSLHEYKKFLKQSKASTYHYIPFNIAKIVSEVYANCVVGVGYDVRFENDSINESIQERRENNNLDSKILGAVTEQSYVGMSMLRMYRKNGKLKVSCLPVGYYYPGNTPSIGESIEDVMQHNVVTTETVGDKMITKIIGYEENDTGNWEMRVSNHDYTNTTDPSLLRSIAFGKDTFKKEIQQDILEYNPIFFFNNEYSCNQSYSMTDSRVKIHNDYYGIGESDIKPIYHMIIALNDILSYIGREFLKHGDSKLSLPASMHKQIQDMRRRKEDEGVDMTFLDRSVDLYGHMSGEQPAQYVTKDASYLSLSKDIIDCFLRYISSVTGIAVSEFGIKVGGANEATDTIKEHKRTFFARCETKRNMIKTTLKKIYRAIAYETTGYNGPLPSITYNEIIQEQTDVDKILRMCDKDIVSRETAMKMLLDLSDEEVIEEMKKISSQQLTQARISGDFISQLGTV